MAVPRNPGFLVSSSVHAALLVVALIGFSRAPELADAQETVPVEMVTDQEFNQIMKGDKTAKEVKPKQKADKIADISETKPRPPVAEAKRDVPTPPSPLKRMPDPGEDDKPEQKPEQAAVQPPPRPTPEPPKPLPKAEPKPEPKPEPKVEAKADPEKPPPEDAEALEPKPVPRPKIDPKIDPKPEAKTAPEPKKPEPQFKPDQVAKLLERDKQKEAQKPASKPKSGDETTEPQRKFDLSDISKLLSKEAPQRKAATGQELQQLASLGTPTANAPKMSPSLMAAIDGYLLDRYRECWAYTPLGVAPAYVAQIRIHFQNDGSLSAEPQLLNPSADPTQRIVAETAMRAVKRCNPLHMPAQYQAYYDYWKSRVIGFNPREM